MTIASMIPFIGGVFAFVLSILSLLNKPLKRQHIIFSLFCLSFTIWLITTSFMNGASTDKAAEFWDRLGYIGVCYAPLLMYHMSIVFRGNEKTSKNILNGGYLVATIFLVLSRYDFFLDGMFWYGKGTWRGGHAVAGPAHHVFMVYCIFFFTLYFINNWVAYSSAKPGFEKERNRILLFGFIASLIGAIAFLPAYKIPIHSFLYFTEIIAMSLFAYAIFRYRFMDIKFIVGRGLIFASTFITVLGVSLGILLLGGMIALTRINDYIIYGIVLIFGFTIYDPIFKFFEKLAAKFFYYSYYSTYKVLDGLSKKASYILDIKELSSEVLETIDSAMGLEKGMVVLCHVGKTCKIVTNNNFDQEKVGKFLADEYFFPLLRKIDGPVTTDCLLTEEGDNPFETSLRAGIGNNMQKADVEICLPLVADDKVYGTLIFGGKKTSNPFTEQDIELFSALSTSASVAFQNAKHYSELQSAGARLEQTVAERTKDLSDANKKLTEVDQAKNDFISIASHQLRSPLTVIKGYLSVILEEKEKVPEEAQRALKVIYDSNERLINFTNNLLDIKSIEEGKMEFAPEKVSFADMIKTITTHYEQKAEEKEVEVVLNIPDSLPPVLADKLKLEQVVTNLIDNAIKYSPKGKVTISLESNNGTQTFKVKDTGEGMSKEELEAIFQKFTRGTQGRKVNVKGTGIGLYIVKKFIDLHEGKVWAESEGIGKGSTFYVALKEE